MILQHDCDLDNQMMNNLRKIHVNLIKKARGNNARALLDFVEEEVEERVKQGSLYFLGIFLLLGLTKIQVLIS